MYENPAAISNEQIQSIVHDINRRGFAVLRNYIDDDLLARIRAFVQNAVHDSHHEYVSFTGTSAAIGSGLDELAKSPGFQALMRRVYEVGTGKPSPRPEFYQVLRCLTGRTAAKHSYRFHYDSYVVTALLPVEIPATGLPGDLIMVPNARPIRPAYWINVLDKILLDNPLTQRLLLFLHKAGWVKLTRLRLEPGSLYLFWGYRSIHTNEPCDTDKVRATALFHFANPHKPTPVLGAERPSAMTTS